jgi:hypothetical protein
MLVTLMLKPGKNCYSCLCDANSIAFFKTDGYTSLSSRLYWKLYKNCLKDQPNCGCIPGRYLNLGWGHGVA